jgi:redox-sensitive bicupin YhaK (pirin superfamily)
VVVQRGSVTLNDSESAEGVALVMFEREGEKVTLEGTKQAKLLVLSGEPIDEPVVGRGPFVMNTAEEIRQAIDDFQRGGMGRLE